MATTIMVAQVNAIRNGLTIQKLAAISMPRASSWKVIRARSSDRSDSISLPSVSVHHGSTHQLSRLCSAMTQSLHDRAHCCFVQLAQPATSPRPELTASNPLLIKEGGKGEGKGGGRGSYPTLYPLPPRQVL